MTNESNENLLKILLNQPEEQPGENKGMFIDLGSTNTGEGNVLTFQVSYKDYTIAILAPSKIVLYDANDTKILEANAVYNGTTYSMTSLCVDSEGYLYGLGSPEGTGNLYLLYLGYITVPDADGNYVLRVNKVYNIETALSQIHNTTGFNSMYSPMLYKSPLDSRFLIVVSGERYGSSQYNLLYLVYHVNFEGENTYEYRVGNISDYIDAFVECTYASWTGDNVSVASIVRNVADYSSTTPQAAKYYKVELNFTEGSTITKTLITTVSNNISPSGVNGRNGIMASLTTGYFPILIKDAQNYITVNIYKYDGTLTSMYQVTGGDAGSSSRSVVYMVYTNNEVFAAIKMSTSSYPSDSNYQAYVLHITDNAEAFNYGESIYDIYGFFVHNIYNYYKISFQRHSGILIYRSNGYSGEPYFNDDSVTPAYTILYSNDTNTLLPIFSRDLYNITKVGNTLNSITQVPFNLLNNNNINEVKLLSKTAEAVTDTIQEIAKNIYEELYINNINSFKVFDNNIGSTYNQECTLKVVDGVLQGFDNNYKITKYRINYTDNTHEDKPITYTEIDGNEGIIRMYIYLTKKGKNVQLYDDNFTVPFLTIDISEFDIEKIYQIVQKIKVE